MPYSLLATAQGQTRIITAAEQLLMHLGESTFSVTIGNFSGRNTVTQAKKGVAKQYQIFQAVCIKLIKHLRHHGYQGANHF